MKQAFAQLFSFSTKASLKSALGIGGLAVILATLGVSAGVSTAPAFSQTKATMTNAGLQEVQSFEVMSFHDTFDVERQHIDSDLLEYVKTALHNDQVLPMKSPAEGVIHLDCSGHAFGYECGYIKVKITKGNLGPVIWENKYRNYYFYSLQKDPRKMAQIISNHLAYAYRNPNAPVKQP